MFIFFLSSFDKLVEFYLDIDKQTVQAKFHIWHSKLQKHVEYPKNCLEALRQCDKNIFPNIYFLLKILCTLPVSTSTPERTFPCLKRLKTYQRNTMTEVFFWYRNTNM